MKMESAVLTGASGVVGSALVRALHARGTALLLLLREGSAHSARTADMVRELLKDGGAPVTVRECSLEHLRDLEAQGDRQYDVFFHLGWAGPKGADRFDPYIHTKNVEYALDAVALAKRLGCHTFVGAGSQAEYGRTEERLTPDLPCHPEHAYGAGKLSAGEMTRIYARSLSMRHIWTRILSVYGPNDGEKTLITYLIHALENGERPSMTAGEQIWDYLYCEDAAEALIAAALRGVDGKTYIVASGKERPLRDYILEVRDIVAPGAEIGLGERPYAPGQVMTLTADISATTADTLWRPRVSFAEGIRRMMKE